MQKGIEVLKKSDFTPPASGPAGTSSGRLFYGWIILAVLCFDHFILLCGYLYTFSSTVSAMVEEFGSTMPMAAMAKTCYSFASALTALAVGWVISRYSARLCLIIAGLAGIIGSALMAFWVRSMPRYILCSVVFLSVMTMFGSGTAAQAIVSRWFRR